MEKVAFKIGDQTLTTDTIEGARYVQKILHPPSTMMDDYAGVPDASSSSVVLMEVKAEAQVPCYENWVSGQKLQDSKVVFLVPPGGAVAAYVFKFRPGSLGPSGTPDGWLQSPNFPAVVNGGYKFADVNQTVKDISAFRPTYKSTTFYLNATNFNNQGTVTVAKFKPRYISTPRVVAKSKTPVAQANQSINFANITITHTGIGGIISEGFPSNATDVLNFSPKATTRPATEGAFIVQEHVNTIHEWQDGGFAETTHSLGDPFDSDVGLPLESGDGFSNDIPWINLDWSLVIFEGLTVGQGDVFITVKSYTGFEIQPMLQSNLRPFAKSLPAPDPTADQMAKTVFHLRPDSLPAAANDFASIMSTLGKYVPAAISAIKEIFGNNGSVFKKNKEEKEVKKVVKQQAKKVVKQKNASESAEIKKLRNEISRLRLATAKQRSPVTKLPGNDREVKKKLAPKPQRSR